MTEQSTPDRRDADAALPHAGLDLSRLERRIHEVVNRVRQSRKTLDLAHDADLASVARSHSERMATEERLFHESPNGRTVRDRVGRFDYDPVAKGSGQSFCHACGADLRTFERPSYCPVCGTKALAEDTGAVPLGENLALHTYERGSIRRTDEGRIASSVVNGWLNSPDHRATLLDERFERHAVGVACIAPTERTIHIYVTQLLS